jgi:hypothetical protein
MTTYAGQMTTTVQANPQWVLADGKPYYVLDAKQPQRTIGVVSEGRRQDYLRNVGWQGRRRGLGPLGWIVLVPLDKTSTYKVSLADDSTETALVQNVTTTTTALVGSGQTVIPVTSATGFVVGLPIAATGIPAGAAITAINGLNITIAPATTGTVASGATVTVTPPGPPTVAKPPAGIT